MVVSIAQSRLLTTSQVAHFLSIHTNTVRRWSNRGIIRAYRIGPRADRRFEKTEVIQFMTELHQNNGDGRKKSDS